MFFARSRLAAFLFILPVIGGLSCAGPILAPLAWEPIPSYAPLPVEAVVAHSPESLLQGEAAPWDGVLVHPDDLNALLAHYHSALSALALAYDGRKDDRSHADQALGACQEAVTVCRGNLPRHFAAGVAAGAGGCGLVVGAVAAGTR